MNGKPAKPRIIKSVLHNFLGTYSSRYSDFNGYWLFGFLVASEHEVEINLLAHCDVRAASPSEVAVKIAQTKFEEQLQKAGLIRSQVQEASLSIRKLDRLEGLVNGHPCAGFRLGFTVEAMMETGKRYRNDQEVFVAPHNPEIELQRRPEDIEWP